MARKPAPKKPPTKKPGTQARKPATKAANDERPKVLVFAIDEIPHVAALADAFKLPQAVRRSPFYFYPSAYQAQVRLPPDRVCDAAETAAGMAFLDRLTIDLSTRAWNPDIFPQGHVRSWHDLPIDVLVTAFRNRGFQVVRASEIMAASGLAESAALAATLPKPAATATTDLFFADLFGMTRVAADGSVRNIAKLSGSGVWIDGDGRLGVLRKQDGVRVIVALAKLREVGALDSGAIMHPAGGAVVRLMPDLSAFDVDVLKSDGTGAAGNLRPNLHVDTTPARELLRLGGGDSMDLVCDQLVAFDATGSFFAWLNDRVDTGWNRSRRSVLCSGRWPAAGDDPTVDWRVELRGPARGIVSLSIAGGVPVVCVADVATSKVHVAIFGDDGAARIRTIDSLIVPARVEQTLVYQPDVNTVVREPLDGGTAARHALPAPHAGRGRVVSRGDRWLFVASDGGTLLDLEHAGRELDRGLPAAEATARAEGFALAEKVRSLIKHAGMDVELTEIDAKRASFGIALSGGGAVLGRALDTALLNYLWASGAHGSLSIRGSYARTINRAVTVDEIVELVRFFANHEMKLEWATAFLDSLHQFPVGMRTPPEPALIEPDAEAVLLWAALDEVAPAGGSDFEKKLAGWMKEAPAPRQVGERLAAVNNGNVGLLNSIAWITVSRFRRDAVDIWLPISEARLRYMGAINALAWLAKNDGDARKALAHWFKTIEDPHTNWKPLAEVLGAQVEEEDDEDTERLPIAPPRGFDKPTTWDAIATAWSGAREMPHLVDQAKAADPAAVARKLGVSALPPSYLEFMRRFFTVGELRNKYEHEKFPYFLDLSAPARLVGQRATYEDSLKATADIAVELRQAAKDLSGLLPFGSNTSRVWICWDPKQTNADGEMQICFIDGDEWNAAKARTNVGYDLKEVLKYYRPGSLDEGD